MTSTGKVVTADYADYTDFLNRQDAKNAEKTGRQNLARRTRRRRRRKTEFNHGLHGWTRIISPQRRRDAENTQFSTNFNRQDAKDAEKTGKQNLARRTRRQRGFKAKLSLRPSSRPSRDTGIFNKGNRGLHGLHGFFKPPRRQGRRKDRKAESRAKNARAARVQSNPPSAFFASFARHRNIQHQTASSQLPLASCHGGSLSGGAVKVCRPDGNCGDSSQSARRFNSTPVRPRPDLRVNES